MRYSIRHVTRFTYESPITESVMEARMQPRTDNAAALSSIHADDDAIGARDDVSRSRQQPRSSLQHPRPSFAPHRHGRSTRRVPDDAPASASVGAGGMVSSRCDGRVGTVVGVSGAEHLRPADCQHSTPSGRRSGSSAATIRSSRSAASWARCTRGSRTARGARASIHQSTKRSTTRKGVCQDFAHIFLSLVRPLGIPARYVSGYLFQAAGSQDRSTDGATHAWVEVLLPDLGWVGLDPTNNLIADDRHIRVAIGRDYADVPPTRGVFKGVSTVRSELSVSVTVGPALSPLSNDLTPFTPWMARESVEASRGRQRTAAAAAVRLRLKRDPYSLTLLRRVARASASSR